LVNHLPEFSSRIIDSFRHRHAEGSQCREFGCCHGVVWCQIGRSHLSDLWVRWNEAWTSGSSSPKRTMCCRHVFCRSRYVIFFHPIRYVRTSSSYLTIAMGYRSFFLGTFCHPSRLGSTPWWFAGRIRRRYGHLFLGHFKQSMENILVTYRGCSDNRLLHRDPGTDVFWGCPIGGRTPWCLRLLQTILWRIWMQVHAGSASKQLMHSVVPDVVRNECRSADRLHTKQ